jgi:hypothetical protein
MKKPAVNRLFRKDNFCGMVKNGLSFAAVFAMYLSRYSRPSEACRILPNNANWNGVERHGCIFHTKKISIPSSGFNKPTPVQLRLFSNPQ